MKKFLSTIIAASFLFSTISCSDDPDDQAPPVTTNQLITTVNDGTWRITLFSEDGIIATSDFTDYNFTFLSNNVVSATNGNTTYNGTYAIMSSNSNDDNPDSNLDFELNFLSPDDFTSLSEDWDVVQTSGNKIQLRHISGGDGSVDLLTFEKN